jgi:hypothetical protein
MTGTEITRTLHVNADINGARFHCVGNSYGIIGSGDAKASVSTQDQLPDGFQISLLSYILLTGDPALSRNVGDAFNPFVETGGAYEAVRRLDLGDRGHIVGDYRVEQDEHGLKSTFDLSGRVDVPPLVSVFPAIESWVPNGPGRISGHFTMTWLTEDGKYIKGEAETRYRLRPDLVLPSVHYRDIRIVFDADNRKLDQHEQIVLFSSNYVAVPFSSVTTEHALVEEVAAPSLS